MTGVHSNTRLPLITIRQFFDGARGWGETHFVRLQGVVTASLSDRTYFLQDGDAGLYVFHNPSEALPVGEWVEVTGHPSLGNLKPFLDGNTVRSLGRRALPPALAVPFAEALSGRHDMRLIRIRGRLAEERPRGGRDLVMNAGGSTNSFLADLEMLSDYDAVARVQHGSLLELTGVCSVRAAGRPQRPVSLTVFVGSAADVVVVSGPPWWTRERMLAVLGLVLGALGLALLWGWTLRRQVWRQTADLRARLEKETALEHRYRQLFETNPQPMWVYDLKTLAFLAVNNAAITRYGYSREEFLGLTIKDIRPPEDVPALLENVERTESGLDVAGVWRHRKKDGRIIEVEITSHTQDFDGRPAALVLAHDVTERRRAEAALRASEQYRRAIIEANPECVKVVAADGLLLDMNAAGLAMLEAGSLAEVQRYPVARFVRPEYHAAFAKLLQRVMAGGSDILEFEIEGLRGARRWLETHAVLLPGADDGRPALLGITRDITERKRTQAELQRLQERFATIFRASPDSILIVRVSDERIVETNPAFTRITGFTGDEVRGRTTGEIDLWVEQEQRAATIAQMKKNGSVNNVESRLRTKSGHIITVLGSAERIEFGGEPCLLSVTRDITDRKLAEDRIRNLNAELEQRVRERTAELETANQELEAFSYSVSHDLRAPLRAIDGFSHILQQEFASRLDETGLRYLARIRAGTDRMAALIDDMLKLSHLSRAPMNRLPVDLTLLVRGLLLELQTAEPARQVEMIVAPGIQTGADPTLLHVALQNLVGNAWKYTRRRPQARIEFGAFDRDGERVFFIRDDGAGFDMAYADKLFDAFQRLHREDEFEGAGIGLATVRRVIHRHGGRIWAEATVDQGAAFFFTLAPKIEHL